jgi:peptidyl-prolyl cis-trans isomerase SurA
MIRYLCLCFSFPLILSAQQLVDGVAAIVGEKIILKSDVLQFAQMNALRSGINFTTNPELASRFQELALESLVIQNILLDRAKVDSLDEVSDEEVDQALEQQIDAMISQIGSESQFEEVMGQSLRDFKGDHWYDIRDQIIAERYRGERIKALEVTRDEVEDFYTTYKDSLPAVDSRYELSQIILAIKPGEEARSRAYKEISSILDSLRDGAVFEELARTHSNDPSSKERGGDLGFVRRGELVQQFEEVAFSLEIGQMSDIVETEFGYHIIQLLDKQGERINVRHILITVTPTDIDREAVLSRIRDYFFLLDESPAHFDSVLNLLSMEDNPPPDLGYVGWIELGLLPDERFISALFGTKPDDITPPFETQDGFHILKVLDYKEGGIPTLEEYYPQIAALALRNKQSTYLENWLKRIRNDVFIKTLY